MMIATLLVLSGCLKSIIDQGNVMKPGLVASIQEGDSRFHVESVLGSPILNDGLHPNRSIYVESYDDPDTGESFLHRVEIMYDKVGRVDSIKSYGFKKK